MPRQNPETRLQIVVVQYLRAVLPRGAVFLAVINEHEGTKAQGALRNAMGRHAGASDLMVLWDGRLICIELKLETNKAYGTKKTRQTQAQRAFEDAVIAQGAAYGVCRNTDEVGRFLTVSGVPIRDKDWNKTRRMEDA